jgi:hypothetical protein
MHRMRTMFAIALFTLVLSAAHAGVSVAAGGWYDWPGMQKCAAFATDDYVIKAYASKETESQRPLTCARATKIMKAWWKGPKSEREYHPGGDYWTLERFPGWRCGDGAGGGSCEKRKRVAGYQNRVA